MNKTTQIILGILALVLIIWGISSASDRESELAGEPIKVGISTILSGDFAALGENIVNTAEMVVSDINMNGGIAGRQVELIVEDSGLDSKTGLSAAEKLTSIDRVHYIIGGTSSNGTLAAAPLVNKKHVLYLTPVTGGSNVDEAGEYVFRIANADTLAGRDIANAMDGLGFSRVGVVAENTEYTADLQKTFVETILDSSMELVVDESFQPQTTDFRSLIAKIKTQNPEALFIPSQTGIATAHFVKQARELGLDVVFFSDFTFVTNTGAQEIIGSFEGMYFADPSFADSSPETAAFLDEYKQQYGISPLIPFHSFATRDSLVLLKEGIETVGDNPKKVKNWLKSEVQNWTGLMGVFSLDGKGNSDLGFVVKHIKNGKFVPVE